MTDPLSGFFMALASVWRERAPCVSAIGFKILLDLLLAAPPHRHLRVRELPYTFREREHGESKLASTVAWDFLLLLLDKKVGRYVPPQFVSFCLVGSVRRRRAPGRAERRLVARARLSGGPRWRDGHRDDDELPDEQRPHLPGAEAARLAHGGGLAELLRRQLRGRPGQHRRRATGSSRPSTAGRFPRWQAF